MTARIILRYPGYHQEVPVAVQRKGISLTAATLSVDLPQGLDQLVMVNVGEVARRYQKRVPEVYAALREGRLEGHKVGQWNWIVFQHELPAIWPEEVLLQQAA